MTRALATPPRYPPLVASAAERRVMLRWLAMAAAKAPYSIKEPDLRGVSSASLADLPALAEGHGVAAQLSAEVVEQLPDGIAEAIRDTASRTLLRAERLREERRAIGEAFLATGIPFFWLKGAWLAERSGSSWPGAPVASPMAATAIATRESGQGSRWLRRPSADIDLLVPAHRSGDAALILGQLGYERDHRTGRHDVYLRPNDHEVLDFRGEHPANPLPVEVHRTFGESFRGVGVDWTSEAWSNSGPVLPAGLGYLHLAAHATTDMLNRRLRLSALFDLAWLAPELSAEDWRRVTKLAASPQSARFALPSIVMATRLMDAAEAERYQLGPLHDELDQFIRPTLWKWLWSLDVDQTTRFGRADAPRRLGEVFGIWPLSLAEAARMWRFVLVPDRWELADRYPRLASTPLWPAMYLRHAAYNLGVLGRRLRVARRRT